MNREHERPGFPGDTQAASTWPGRLLACPVVWIALLAGCAASRSEPADWPAIAPSNADAQAHGTARNVEPAVPDLSDRPSVRALLRLALERSPRVAAAREQVLAASEVSAIDSSLPDPKLLLGWYATSVETRVGPQEFVLGVQQGVPFPSKLRSRSELGATLARRQQVVYERAVRDILVEVLQAAHELAYIDEATEIAGRIASLLERYTTAAAQMDTASALSELFRAETQRAQLDNDRVILRELRAVEVERILALLDLPTGTPVGTPDIERLPPVEASFEELLRIAQAHNQELMEAGLSLEAARLRTDLARKERLPDFTLGYTHIFTGDLPSSVGNPPGNGEDAQLFTLGLSLPIWANRNSASIRRAEALERAARAGRRDAALRLRMRLARAWFQVGNAQRLVRLYGEVLVPRAETAARTAEDLHAAGKGALAGTIETIAVLQNFRLAAARARSDYGQAVAALEAILGQPLRHRRRQEGGSK